MNLPSATPTDPGRLQRAMLLIALLAMCLAFLMRFQLMNGFSVLQGDRYDGVIATSILEHWFRVFRGLASWSDAGYFYPYADTLAQTDGYFLIGLAYLPFRLLGVDPFLATELTGLVIKAVGFAGAYLLCRKAFALSFSWSALAALLFTLSNGMTIHGWRVQLASVAIAPVLALLLWQSVRALLDGAISQFTRKGIAAGVLYGAWCLTCFYMAWFFMYFTLVMTAVLLLNAGRSGRAALWGKLASHVGAVLLVIGSALASVLPFVLIYLPKSREVGVRSYETLARDLGTPSGVLQVGPDNFMFGHLYQHLLSYFPASTTPPSEYYNTGFTPVLLALFVFGCVHLLKAARRPESNRVLVALALATLISWPLTLAFFGHSAWFAIYHLLPGAKALRMISIYQILLALPVVIIALVYLARQRLSVPIAALLAALLLLGEANTPYMNLDRKTELARIALPHPVPAGCRAFYASGWNNEQHPDPHTDEYAHNVTAMMVAQMTGLPTLNGFASFNPPDWVFGAPNRPDYQARVFAYALTHKVSGLCLLDLNTKQWSAVALPTVQTLKGSTTIPFNISAWPGVLAGVQGMSVTELWGTWSSGEHVTIAFAAPLPKKFTLHLFAHAFGPNVGKAFVAHLGERTLSFTLGDAGAEKLLEFDNPSGAQSITIDVPVPTSPKMLGMGGDERLLGIGIAKLQIDAP